MPDNDITITLVYTTNKYDIIIYAYADDENKTQLADEEYNPYTGTVTGVAYGTKLSEAMENAQAPAVPGYTFKKEWTTPNFDPLGETRMQDYDADVNALYTVNTYAINFEITDEDGNELTKNIEGAYPTDFELDYGMLILENVEHSNYIIHPTIKGFEFDHWEYNGKAIEADTKVGDHDTDMTMTLTAVYKRTGYVITYHFKDGDPRVEEVAYDTDSSSTPKSSVEFKPEENTTGVWVEKAEDVSDDGSEYYDLFVNLALEYDNTTTIDSDIDVYEGICIDVCKYETDDFGTHELGLQRIYNSDIYRKCGETLTDSDIAKIKNNIGSDYYLLCNGNTDTLFTDAALPTESLNASSLSTENSVSLVQVWHRINVSVDDQTILMNYTNDFNKSGSNSMSEIFFEAVYDYFRQLNEGEMWYLEFGDGTGQWFERDYELNDIGKSFQFINTLWTLTAKTPENVTEVTFIESYSTDDNSSQTNTLKVNVGDTIGKLPQLYNGTIWVYVNENGSYSEFTTETPVTENMEIYNGVKIYIMDCDSNMNWTEYMTIPARAYTYSQMDPYRQIPTELKFTDVMYTKSDNEYYRNNIDAVNAEDITVYLVTHEIQAQRYNENYPKHTYLMNSNCDDNPLNWLLSLLWDMNGS